MRGFEGGGGEDEDDASKDLLGSRSTSCRAFFMAFRSKPAWIGRCEDEAVSLEGVDGRDGVGVFLPEPGSCTGVTLGEP